MTKAVSPIGKMQIFKSVVKVRIMVKVRFREVAVVVMVRFSLQETKVVGLCKYPKSELSQIRNSCVPGEKNNQKGFVDRKLEG